MGALLDVEEALERVLAHVPAPRVEEVPLGETAGRVLAAPVRAAEDFPAFPRSRVDGYAVRSADATKSGADFPIAFEVPAGRPAQTALPPGGAARVFTGAAVPEGADAVVMQEDCEALPGGTSVRVGRVVAPGAFVVPRGHECAAGEVVARRGDVVTAAVSGVLASVGAADVSVFAAPGARVVSTGDELFPVSATPPEGGIRNSNGPALLAALASFGAVPLGAAHAADDSDVLAAATEHALGADLCVLTGGVSVGDYDLVPAVLERLGVTCVFHGVRMQPGKPLLFGVRDRTLVFGLPGNPVSALVTATLFVAPAVLALLGRPAPQPRPAVLAGPLAAGTWRRRYEPVRLTARPDGRLDAVPVRYGGSGDIFGLSRANALAVVPEEHPARAGGDDVLVLPMGEYAL